MMLISDLVLLYVNEIKEHNFGIPVAVIIFPTTPPPPLLGHIAQSVMCVATDACLTADPGLESSIQTLSRTFVEIDHDIISTVILLLPLIHSETVVSYKRKYVHKLLVNRLFKPAQE